MYTSLFSRTPEGGRHHTLRHGNDAVEFLVVPHVLNLVAGVQHGRPVAAEPLPDFAHAQSERDMRYIHGELPDPADAQAGPARMAKFASTDIEKRGGNVDHCVADRKHTFGWRKLPKAVSGRLSGCTGFAFCLVRLFQRRRRLDLTPQNRNDFLYQGAVRV